MVNRFLMAMLMVCAMLGSSLAMAGEQTVVRMTTNMGEIEMTLDDERAPKTVANFVRYAKEGFYNGTLFHRVIANFMIQGGGFSKDMRKKSTHAAILNEADNGLRNSTGTIAMARTSSPDSATSQFFINTHDNGFLNHRGETSSEWGYAVFGRVTKGMDVVRKIEAVQTGGRSGMADVPLQPVVIEKVEVVE
jgi:cyclophilin family peptidyl-prolyl cis-trans isomerase